MRSMMREVLLAGAAAIAAGSVGWAHTSAVDVPDGLECPPDAVLEKVIHALEAKRPKIRYYVTFPTWLFAILKRLLPHRRLDWVLRRVSRGENK